MILTLEDITMVDVEALKARLTRVQKIRIRIGVWFIMIGCCIAGCGNILAERDD
jgi:hypothetical protein